LWLSRVGVVLSLLRIKIVFKWVKLRLSANFWRHRPELNSIAVASFGNIPVPSASVR
jgi:hypothetical protein